MRQARAEQRGGGARAGAQGEACGAADGDRQQDGTSGQGAVRAGDARRAGRSCGEREATTRGDGAGGGAARATSTAVAEEQRREEVRHGGRRQGGRERHGRRRRDGHGKRRRDGRGARRDGWRGHGDASGGGASAAAGGRGAELPAEIRGGGVAHDAAHGRSGDHRKYASISCVRVLHLTGVRSAAITSAGAPPSKATRWAAASSG